MVYAGSEMFAVGRCSCGYLMLIRAENGMSLATLDAAELLKVVWMRLAIRGEARICAGGVEVSGTSTGKQLILYMTEDMGVCAECW